MASSPRDILSNLVDLMGERQINYIWVGSAQKESTCSVGDTGDMGSIPGLGRSPGGGKWQPSPVFLPKNPPGTEEPGRLQSKGSQRIRHDWATKHALV